METPIPNSAPEPTPARCALKIFGAGSAGVALLTQLRAGEFLPAQFVAVDSASAISAGEIEKIEICKSLLGGHGAHRAEPGKVELAGQFNAVKPACVRCDTVFILAGLGGRTGSWMSAAVARAAKEAGAMVFAFVTLPFDCEGSVRFSKARQALERLEAVCDFVFIQPHQDFCTQNTAALSLVEAYRPASARLLAGLRHAAGALSGSTIMGIGFTDLCALLREHRAQVLFAVGLSVAAANRAGAVVEELLAHPRLQNGRLLGEAETVAVSLVGGQDLRMADVNEVMQELGKHWQGTSQLMSASVGNAAQGPFGVLLLAITHEAAQGASRLTSLHEGAKPQSESSAFDTHYLSGANETKPTARFSTDSAPSSAAASRPRSGRARQSGASRMRQGQLPLDIANKGRFEKSEPTIHKGEDLDIPTFIRRGVLLN